MKWSWCASHSVMIGITNDVGPPGCRETALRELKENRALHEADSLTFKRSRIDNKTSRSHYRKNTSIATV